MSESDIDFDHPAFDGPIASTATVTVVSRARHAHAVLGNNDEHCDIRNICMISDVN